MIIKKQYLSNKNYIHTPEGCVYSEITGWIYIIRYNTNSLFISEHTGGRVTRWPPALLRLQQKPRDQRHSGVVNPEGLGTQPEEVRGPSQADRHRFPSRLPDGVPDLQRVLLDHVQDHPTRGRQEGLVLQSGTNTRDFYVNI